MVLQKKLRWQCYQMRKNHYRGKKTMKIDHCIVEAFLVYHQVYWLKLSLAEPLLAMLVRWTASEAAFPSAAILPDRARRVAEKKTVTGNSYQAGRLQTGWEYCWKPAGERVCGGGRGIKPTSLSTASHLRRKSFSDKTQRSPAPQRNKQTNKQTNKSQRSPAPQRPQVGDRVQQFAGLASIPDMDPTNRSQTRDLCRQLIMILATVPTVLVDMKWEFAW